MKVRYYEAPCKCGIDTQGLFDAAAEEKGIKADIKVIKDIVQASRDGVPELPALYIDDKLVDSGYKLSYKDMGKVLKKANK